MKTTVVVPTNIDLEFRRMAALEHETAGVLLVSIVQAKNGDMRILAREIIWVPDDQYLHREAYSLGIPSMGYVAALGKAEADGASCIWVHTHPGEQGIPLPSEADRVVDEQLAETFRVRSGSDYYGTLIFSPRSNGLAFSGYISRGAQHRTIDRLWVVGDRLKFTTSFDTSAAGMAAVYDRNIRAFGADIQRTLGSLTVGVVGCGGTGSAVIEQLARLGVRKFVLIDADELSASNVTRVYGAFEKDIGRPKVDIQKDHVTRISSEVKCDVVRGMLTLEHVAKALMPCDVVFGCTDDNAGRLVLSRFSTFFLTPVIDCGVLLTSDADNRLVGIDGRVTVLTPGQGCLICRGRIDVARAAAELMTPEERIRLQDEGYAPALQGVEPAVVTFTSAVAAAAVSELLERLIGYGVDQRPSELLLRYHDREISTNHALPREGHYCHHNSGKWGKGMGEPFLEQMWPKV